MRNSIKRWIDKCINTMMNNLIRYINKLRDTIISSWKISSQVLINFFKNHKLYRNCPIAHSIEQNTKKSIIFNHRKLEMIWTKSKKGIVVGTAM